MFCAAAEENGVKARSERLDRDINADVRIGPENDAFGFHLVDAAIDDIFFELKVGNAVAEKAADTVGLFEDSDRVAGAAKLLRSGEAGGPLPTTATRLPVACSGGSGWIQPSSRRARRWSAR